jgi:hypothetical protein
VPPRPLGPARGGGQRLQTDSSDLIIAIGSSRAFQIVLQAEYTATSTGNKTFVATGGRRTETGNNVRYAASAYPPT